MAEMQYPTPYKKIKKELTTANFQELYNLKSLNQDWMPLKDPQAQPEFICFMQELLD